MKKFFVSSLKKFELEDFIIESEKFSSPVCKSSEKECGHEKSNKTKEVTHQRYTSINFGSSVYNMLECYQCLDKKKKKVSNASTVSLLTVFPSFIPLVFVANRSLHFLLPNCFPYRFNNISVVLVNAVSFCQFMFMRFEFSFSHAGASCWSLFLLLLWVPMRLLLICCLIT